MSRSKCPSRLRRKLPDSVAAASGLASTTKSHAGKPVVVRNASRAMRFKRFRSTARFAARREIVRPSLAASASFGRPSTVKNESAERVASAKTRANSAGVWRRRKYENPLRTEGNGRANAEALRA